jgi:hypothetical protein
VGVVSPCSVSLLIYSARNGLKIYTPFVHLPPRSLTDYYQYIQRPTSLKSVQKKVRGVHGRNGPTGITDLTSWDAFEDEMDYIWKNAQDYNEDGSDIFLLADDLKVSCSWHKLSSHSCLVY